jgi:regulator of sirC expression with transglutaminase-like and TPR domain
VRVGSKRMDRTLRERFTALLARPDATIPLDEVALVIAAHARPDLDIDAELRELDALAAQVRDPTLTGVLRLLFRDLGFDGNREAYYDPRNSFLDEVVRRRTGIPITLAVVTMEVARRVSVPLWGVGMPGHFLLRDKVDPDVFVDPFHHGRTLDPTSCAKVFRQIHGPTARFDPAFLAPVDRASIVARMLSNLRGIYAQRGDHASLAWVLGLAAALPAAGAAAHVEHAEALRRSGDVVAAIDAHERAAAMLASAGDDAAEQLRAAALLRARMN